MVVAVESAATAVAALRKSDVREEFYRASGKGGQNRNKVESAVKLTHLPTGITAISADERSQGKNRDIAWRRLEDKVQRLEQASKASKQAQEKADQFNLENAWTWTDYADEVKSPNGSKASMKRALRGDLKKLLS